MRSDNPLKGFIISQVAELDVIMLFGRGKGKKKINAENLSGDSFPSYPNWNSLATILY